MYCKEHSDYVAKRQPKVNCFSCWRLYTETKGFTVEDAIATAEYRGDIELKNWLRESIDDIIYASLEGGEKKASFSKPFRFVEDEKKTETHKVATPVSDPIRGRKI